MRVVPGILVFARWVEDGCYYPGKLLRRTAGGQWAVLFCDGNKCECDEDDVIVCDLLPVGFDALAAQQGKPFEPAVITGHVAIKQRSRDGGGYTVRFGSGVECR